ncbi:hypothetical protein GCM10010121_092500 [Streptomyces brasiliensis]|uniref:MmyB-like transcription regulator ligand binding domain-containing protein n=1 Tax=Streptomyces brasiliensis TaxID=1954 RepID=A0A917ULZ9_9ACTN|nr:hypothetical protein GCM10010121_092500 [Streptomyces brasiliensis]
MHRDRAHDAHVAVSVPRMEAAADPDLAQFVGELSLQDPDFRTWWAEHHVSSASYGTKHDRHHLVGDLTLDCDTWTGPDGSGQRLMVLTADPGSPSHDALCILTYWTAERTDATAVRDGTHNGTGRTTGAGARRTRPRAPGWSTHTRDR